MKLRSGLRDRRGGSLKVRLKAPETDEATGSRQPGNKQGKNGSAGGQKGLERLPRLSVKLGGAQKQSPPVVAAQHLEPGQKNQSLRVKLRVNSLEGSIPQVDGAADSENDQHSVPHACSRAAADQQNELLASGIAESTCRQEVKQREDTPGLSVACQHAAAADAAADAMAPPWAGSKAQQEAYQISTGADAMHDSAPMHEVSAAHTAETSEDAAASVSLPAGADLAQAKKPVAAEFVTAILDPTQTAKPPEADMTDEPLAESRPNFLNGQALIPGQPSVDLAGGPGPASRLEESGGAKMDVLSASREHIGKGEAGLIVSSQPDQAQLHDGGLMKDELAALPLLVRALREWLDTQGYHVPGIGVQEDAQV